MSAIAEPAPDPGLTAPRSGPVPYRLGLPPGSVPVEPVRSAIRTTDVAAAAGISPSRVWHQLNGDDPMSAQLRQGLRRLVGPERAERVFAGVPVHPRARKPASAAVKALDAAGVRTEDLAAHALVASFLGATTVKAKGLHGWGWGAVAALVIGLALAAILLSPWKLSFAIDSPKLYEELQPGAAEEADAETLGWLVSAAYGYQKLRAGNATRVTVMSVLLTTLGVLMVAQTLLWLAALR